MRSQLKRFVAAGSVASACLLGSLALSPAAWADEQLTFSYNDGTDPVLAGVLDGTLSGDYFTVTGIDSLTLNGSAVSFTPIVLASEDTFALAGEGYNGNGSAVVTLDGSYMDFVAIDASNDGFAFAVGDVISGSFGSVYATEGSFGFVYDAAFDQSGWSASVPEPMSAAILGIALPGLMVARKRRASRKAA